MRPRLARPKPGDRICAPLLGELPNVSATRFEDTGYEPARFKLKFRLIDKRFTDRLRPMNRESSTNPTRMLEQVRDLRQLRDIAQREHGPQGRSTKRIQEALTQAERDLENGRADFNRVRQQESATAAGWKSDDSHR